MTKSNRLKNIFSGLLSIGFAILMIALPADGYKLILFIVGLAMILSGIRKLVFYLSMARHMVGGKSQLFIGLIELDLGAFTYSLNDIPLIYIVLYLLAYHAFVGGIAILRSLEAKRFGSGHWKLLFSTGVINILVALFAVIGGIALGSPAVTSYIYGAGLIWSGITTIAGAFRKTAIVYIP